jgi:hypothetical protein
MHDQRYRSIVLGVKSIHVSEIDITNDIRIEDEHGVTVPKIGHVADTAAGSKDFGLVPCHHRKRIGLFGNERFDLSMVVMGVDHCSRAAGAYQPLDDDIQQRSLSYREQRFGYMLAVWAEPRAKAGGKDHCFHD